MLASLGQTAAVCEYLLERERFDLFAVVLGGVGGMAALSGLHG